MPSFLLYGSYGYTGRLIAEHAVQQGHRPLLAGRNAKRLAEQAGQLGLDYRAFALEDTAALDAALKQVDAVLHCAGPFVHTFRQMAEACLRTGKHYVDISGEIDGFEALAALDAQARRTGIVMLPGAGFDVVPSDCLAAHLAGRLPGATHLRLFIRGAGSGISRGTARSGIESMRRQGRIRRDGRIVQVPAAWRMRSIDFGRGPVRLVSVGWGDVSTAFHSTGIPNVETYMAFPLALRIAMIASRFIGPLLYMRPTRAILRWLVNVFLPPGPSREKNLKGRALMVAEVADGQRTVRARISTPEAYRLTALAAVEVMRRILALDFKPGFQTPSRLYGADFILGFPGVVREDMEDSLPLP